MQFRLIILLLLFISLSTFALEKTDCNKIVMSGRATWFGFKNDKELNSYIENFELSKISLDMNIRSPWEYSLIPSLKSRLIGFEEQLLYVVASNSIDYLTLEPKLSAINSRKYIYNLFNSSIKKNLYIDDEPLMEIRDLKNHNHSNYKNEIDQFFTLKTLALCSFYAIKDSVNCSKILSKIINEMLPVNDITLVNTVEDVLFKNVKIYEASLIKIALKLIKKVDLRAKNAGHLFDDIFNEFLISGYSVNEANNFTMNTIAVLASRGANFYLLQDLKTIHNYKTISALAIISSAISVLDSLTFDSGSPYSFPKEVIVNCDSGKWYHFWMTAFLARKSYLETKDKNASLWASYLSNVGYQMKSKTVGRDPNFPFKVNSLDLYNQKIRIDLAYAGAGAYFGSQSFNKNKLIDIEAALNYLISSTESISYSSKNETFENSLLNAFLNWNKIFHPEAVINFFTKL